MPWRFTKFYWKPLSCFWNILLSKRRDIKHTLAEVIISNHHKWTDCTKHTTVKLDQIRLKTTQLGWLFRSEFVLLFQRGHNVTPVRRNLSINRWVQLNYWNRPSVRTPSKFLCVECMQMHFSYLNGKTSEVQMNPLSDVMLLWLCMQVYMYNTK